MNLQEMNKIIGNGEWINWDTLMSIKASIPTFFGYYPTSQFDGNKTEREIENNSEVFKLKQGKIIQPLVNEIIENISTFYNINEIDYITLTPDSGNKKGNFDDLAGFSFVVQYISDELGKPIILPKIVKDMGKQKDMPRLERIKNRRHAYSFQDIDLYGKKVLFIDDVITTGSTMCAMGEDIINKGGVFLGYGVAQSELDKDNI